MSVTIFCDMDGVLSDFDDAFKQVMGMYPKEADKDTFKQFWNKVCVSPDFWANMGVMSDYKVLWDFIKPYNPIILTGCPYSGKWNASKGKKLWRDKHLGDNYELIATMSNIKQKFMKAEGDILIDDNQDNCRRWNEAGGISILHTNAQSSVEILQQLLGGR